jgi:hypothetical protein
MQADIRARCIFCRQPLPKNLKRQHNCNVINGTCAISGCQKVRLWEHQTCAKHRMDLCAADGCKNISKIAYNYPICNTNHMCQWPQIDLIARIFNQFAIESFTPDEISNLYKKDFLVKNFPLWFQRLDTLLKFHRKDRPNFDYKQFWESPSFLPCDNPYGWLTQGEIFSIPINVHSLFYGLKPDCCNPIRADGFCKTHLEIVRLYKRLCACCGKPQNWKYYPYLLYKAKYISKDISRYLIKRFMNLFEGPCSKPECKKYYKMSQSEHHGSALQNHKMFLLSNMNPNIAQDKYLVDVNDHFKYYLIKYILYIYRSWPDHVEGLINLVKQAKLPIERKICHYTKGII